MTDEANPFVDARASAVIANEVAGAVLRHLEEALPAGVSTNVGVVEPVSATFPQHPLDTAVRDLAIATLASSHAAEAAGRAGTETQARAAGDAARLAAHTLVLTEEVAGSPQLRSNAAQRSRVAHAAARTAFAAADLLHDPPSGLHGREQSIAFPGSWRRLIEMLSRAIDDCAISTGGQQQQLIRAATAARDGADAARHAYERLGRLTTARPSVCRFVRVASLAAAYAGCAALVPLRVDDRAVP
ncbi:MAG: hypothetical protein M3Y41_18280 [Pseudomonadota bacterium]|nr:hypothetical protein [Pseudomonadota bacterium]